jgi:hypothetical protein
MTCASCLVAAQDFHDTGDHEEVLVRDRYQVKVDQAQMLMQARCAA